MNLLIFANLKKIFKYAAISIIWVSVTACTGSFSFTRTDCNTPLIDDACGQQIPVNNVSENAGNDNNAPQKQLPLPNLASNLVIDPQWQSNTLSWSAAENAAGYLIARSTDGPVSWVPQAGKSYLNGEVVASGVTIVAVASTSSWVDLNLQNQTKYFYQVYSFNKDHAYTSGAPISATPGLRETSFLGAASEDIAFNGNYAYLAAGAQGLVVVDISDPSNPSVVSTLRLPAVAKGVALNGNTVFIVGQTTDYSGTGCLFVINITDPAKPFIQAQSVTAYQPRKVEYYNNHLYVSEDYLGGLEVLDVTDPNAVVSLGAAPVVARAQDAVVNGQYLYVADYGNGLIILDVSNPANPSHVATYDTPGFAKSIAIKGTTAYVADNTQGMVILNVSNPASPTFIKKYDTSGTEEYVAVAGEFAYLYKAGTGVEVVNVANPNSPSQVTLYPTNATTFGWVAVHNSYLYMPDFLRRLLVFDITAPNSSFTETASIKNLIRPMNGIHRDGYLYVADGWLSVIDTQNPQQPEIVGQASLAPAFGYEGQNIVLQGNFAYVSSGPTGGVSVIDITSPTNPVHRGTYVSPSWAYRLAVKENYAYLADGDVVIIVDVSDPDNPTFAGSIATTEAEGIAIVNDLAYVADGSNGLRIYDLSNPVSPVQLGSVATSNAENVNIFGQKSYVSNGSKFYIIDISDPTSPAILGSTSSTGGAVKDIEVRGNLAFVANFIQSFLVYSVADAANPTLLETHSTYNLTLGISISDDTLYVYDWIGGLIGYSGFLEKQ